MRKFRLQAKTGPPTVENRLLFTFSFDDSAAATAGDSVSR